MTSSTYRYSEDKLLHDLQAYIDQTYGEHYAQTGIQTMEFIIDNGHGLGFCIGMIIKYLQRYGKKAGYNRQDLLKVAHCAIILLHIHDREHENQSKSLDAEYPAEFRAD